ncbi:hypothetical protein PYCCODRAFT_877497 [Trametes coccinea BRFM310]|uniref:Uncharacterized protein n=1 Tax=Trametes coccinea (strain BRFM310) TaxID=1353009 RepID=A0A1Y2IDQ0_TRAC3|nr:hypothetical protein PYCCODRAFT_877497 [Trametes coccinea BRFM310]
MASFRDAHSGIVHYPVLDVRGPFSFGRTEHLEHNEKKVFYTPEQSSPYRPAPFRYSHIPHHVMTRPAEFLGAAPKSPSSFRFTSPRRVSQRPIDSSPAPPCGRVIYRPVVRPIGRASVIQLSSSSARSQLHFFSLIPSSSTFPLIFTNTTNPIPRVSSHTILDPSRSPASNVPSVIVLFHVFSPFLLSSQLLVKPSSLCPAVHPSPCHYLHDPLLSSSDRPDLGVACPLVSPSQPHAPSIATAFPQRLHLARGLRLLVTSSHPCVLPPAIPNLSPPFPLRARCSASRPSSQPRPLRVSACG